MTSSKSYLGEDDTFLHSVIEESKYCTDMVKKHFDKELIMAKEDDELFMNARKCWVCGNAYVDGDVRVRDHCNIIEKQKVSAHGDCNINVKLNHKIPINQNTHPKQWI